MQHTAIVLLLEFWYIKLADVDLHLHVMLALPTIWVQQWAVFSLFMINNKPDVRWLLFQLHYLRLPKDIKDHYIMLMDATVATGAAAMMAIRVLLDHDVKQENITLCSLLMAQSGR